MSSVQSYFLVEGTVLHGMLVSIKRTLKNFL